MCNTYKQDFRNYIWSKIPNRDDILVKAALLPTEEMKIQFVLDKDLAMKSYVYIDFPKPVLDGGYYYSIDLKTYIQKSKH